MIWLALLVVVSVGVLLPLWLTRDLAHPAPDAEPRILADPFDQMRRFNRGVARTRPPKRRRRSRHMRGGRG